MSRFKAFKQESLALQVTIHGKAKQAMLTYCSKREASRCNVELHHYLHLGHWEQTVITESTVCVNQVWKPPPHTPLKSPGGRGIADLIRASTHKHLWRLKQRIQQSTELIKENSWTCTSRTRLISDIAVTRASETLNTDVINATYLAIVDHYKHLA